MNIDKYKLKEEELECRHVLKDININTTKDIESISEIIGQNRAIKAIELGLKIDKKGYNIYVSGDTGVGKTSYTSFLIKKHLEKSNNKNIKDWVYVNNFKNKNEPISLSFSPGLGKVFKKDIEEIIENIKEEIPKIFNSKEYEYHNRLLIKELEDNIQQIINELNEFTQPKGFKFQVTEKGLMSIPIKEDGNLMKEEELGSLTTVEISKLREEGIKINQESKEYINKIKSCENEYKNKNSELDKIVGKSLIEFYAQYLNNKYGKDNKVNNYVKDMSEDIIENICKFKENNENTQNPMAMLGIMPNKNENKFFDRYKVNLFIDNSENNNSNIIIENNPTYYNLTGSIDYKNEIGALTTSFMEIKPGALHKANGGYLIINVKDLLSNPFSWDCLKRSLKTEKITIESLNKQLGYLVTSTINPEPIDLDIKVVLIGNEYLYSVLYNYEEDFKKLFKIMADFDVEIDKNDENIYKTVQFIANKCNEENLKHFDKGALERIIYYSSRISDNKDKLTAKFNYILDLMYESNVVSNEENEFVTKENVEDAISQKIYRNNKYEEKLNEMFKEETLLIDTEGEKVGQINGLAVISTGEYSFGKPSKITASTYQGKRGVINVEREVKQSGTIHDKGVLILSGYLGARYGKEKPIAINTSITFEQNYSGVDGDSASSTELYAIISSISNIPIKQSIAVTGSVSQKGEIQPIGGINQKIEGYFDVCKIKGLTGEQGVLMPIQNIKNLVLKQEVIEAIRNKKFNIYAISNIEEGLEILTGISIKEIDEAVNRSLEEYRKSDKDDKSSKNNKEDKDNK